MSVALPYNPRACGALCDLCPLRDRGQMVAPRSQPRARLTVVGDYPSNDDVRRGQPLAGLAGRVFAQAIDKQTPVNATYAVLCRPPNGDLEAFTKSFRVTNKEATRAYREYDRTVTKTDRAYKKACAKWETVLGRLRTQVEATHAQLAMSRLLIPKTEKQAERHGTVLIKLHVKLEGLRRKLVEHEAQAPVEPASIAAPTVARPILEPIAACRPRLMRELHATPGAVVTFGEVPLKVITGEKGYIDAIGGPQRWEPAFLGTEDGLVPTVVQAPLYTDSDEKPAIPLWEGNKETAQPTVPPLWLLPTVHPGNLGGKMEGYAGAFVRHVERATRYSREGAECNWRDPTVVFTPLEVAKTLRRLERHANVTVNTRIRVALDVETAGLDVVFSDLRCIGLSWRDVEDGTPHAVVIPVRRIDTTPFLDGLWPIIHRLLRRLLKNPGVWWVPHNGIFDRSVMLAQFGEMGPGGDTLLKHHAIESEVPHSLAFLSSLLLDAPVWKEEKHGLALKAGQDERLWVYNGRDAFRTLCIDEELDRVLETEPPGVRKVYEDACQLQPIYTRMTVRGLLVDEERRRERVKVVEERHARCVQEMRAVLREALNEVDAGHRNAAPEVVAIVRAALAEGTDVPLSLFDAPLAPPAAAAAPGSLNYTGVANIQAFLRLLEIKTKPAGEGNDPDRQSTTEDDLLGAVMIGTPLQKRFVGQKESKAKKTEGRGYIGASEASKTLTTFLCPPKSPDGRTRPAWKMHGTVTGRISCEDPNLMNVPYAERAIYCAPPGYKYIGVDYSALELWGVAICAGAKGLIHQLKTADVHRKNTEALFGLLFVDEIRAALAAPFKGEKADCVLCRNAGPRTRAGGPAFRSYTLDEWTEDGLGQRVSMAAGQGKNIDLIFSPHWCPDCKTLAEQAFEGVRKMLKRLRELAKRFVYAVNYRAVPTTIWASLSPEFPDLQIGEVVAMCKTWDQMYPEITTWAQKQLDLFAHRRLREGMGYLESPIRGRRRYWTGKDFGPSDAANYPIQSFGADVIDGALIRVDPLMRDIGAHLVLQVHDNLTFEVPDERVDEAKQILLQNMSGPYQFREVAGEWYFPVEVAVGTHWDKA